MSDMDCKNCKNELGIDQEFCTACGEKVSVKKPHGIEMFRKLKSLFLVLFTKKIILSIFLLTFLIFIFYWFAYLPKAYRAGCYEFALNEVGGYNNTKSSRGMEKYEDAYKKCLTSHGIK